MTLAVVTFVLEASEHGLRVANLRICLTQRGRLVSEGGKQGRGRT